MESKQCKNSVGLLPNYFKKVGIIMMILVPAAAIGLKLINEEFFHSHKEVLKMIFLNVLILGLFFTSWSKDRIEDELTLLIRLRSMAWAFGTAVFYVIFRPIVDLTFRDPIRTLTGQEVILTMLLGYLVMYIWQKRSR